MVELAAKPRTVYIIDYGLAKLYQNAKTKAHIPFREGKKLTGTARYASIYTHQGYEQSRRDDLECLGYVLIYFVKGMLPWQGLRGGNKDERYDKVMQRKQSTTIETLCKSLPIEFTQYLYYARAIKFEDKPDYVRLKKLFRTLFHKQKMEQNFDYDWNKMVPDARKISFAYRLADESLSHPSNEVWKVREKRKPQESRKVQQQHEEESPKRKDTTRSLGVGLRFQPTIKSTELQPAAQKDDPYGKYFMEINVKTQNTVQFDKQLKFLEGRQKPKEGVALSPLSSSSSSCNLDAKDILEDAGLLGTAFFFPKFLQQQKTENR